VALNLFVIGVKYQSAAQYDNPEKPEIVFLPLGNFSRCLFSFSDCIECFRLIWTFYPENRKNGIAAAECMLSFDLKLDQHLTCISQMMAGTKGSGAKGLRPCMQRMRGR
jgi:hypothetical protein